MADPLSILRDFHINKKEITVRDDLIIFGDIAFRKTAKTNYLVYGYEPESPNKEYYTLDCLVFFLQNIELQHPLYVRKATTDAQCGAVRRVDRKDLLAYMSGETSTSDRIDRLAPIETPVPFKRAAEEDKSIARRPRVETEKNIRDREKLQARLEAPRDQGATVSTAKLTSLSEAIPVEKLAALKAKRLAQKRGQIRQEDTIGALNDFPIVAETESDGLQDILSRERVGRTRSDVTRGPKNLTERLAPIFQMIKAKEERKKNEGTNKAPGQIKPSIPAPKPALAPVSYNRYGQEEFNKASGLEFGIKPMESYRGAQDAKASEASAEKIVPRSQSESGDSSRKRASKTPIIFVPSGPTSLITTYNCVDILQENRFVSTDQKKREGARCETDLLIQRKKPDGSVVAIRILDNPAKLSNEDWDRVVAVFVHGPAWQFKGWPWQNPPDIFERIKPFHLQFDEIPLDKNIIAWNVNVIPISKTKRHLDRASLLKFWENLDRFVAKNKPHLRW